jgi:hypothetical protein
MLSLRRFSSLSCPQKAMAVASKNHHITFEGERKVPARMHSGARAGTRRIGSQNECERREGFQEKR